MAASLAAGSVGTRAADAGQRLHVKARAGIRKTTENDAGHRGAAASASAVAETATGAARSAETIDTGANRLKCDRAKAVVLRRLNGAAIAQRQQRVLAIAAAMPDRADGMDHMTGREPITFGDFGIARRAAMQRVAFG